MPAQPSQYSTRPTPKRDKTPRESLGAGYDTQRYAPGGLMAVRNKGLAWLLAVIFGAIHLVVVGGGILEGAFDGDGALGLVLADWPLLALCWYSALGRHLCSFIPRGWVIYVLAGTLIYTLVGFVIGAVIDRIRTLIAQRQDRG